MPWEISLWIDSRLENLRPVRAAIRGLSDEAELPETQRHQVELCLSEAVSNCIEHAYGGATDQPIRVRCRKDAEGWVLSVFDQGRPMALGHLERARNRPLEIDPDDAESLRDRGRGLCLIQQAVRKVHYAQEDGWNRLDLHVI